jgi:hypothetical protein
MDRPVDARKIGATTNLYREGKPAAARRGGEARRMLRDLIGG